MNTFHSFQEHTGEIELALGAPTFGGLFAEGGRALAELMLAEDQTSLAPAGPETVTVNARDGATLLVEWLNELIFLSETKKAVFSEVEVQRASDTEIVAHVRGVAEPSIRTAVKAATLHGARLTRTDKGLRAHVVLDV